MKVKILNTQDEKEINKELDKLEKKERDIENVTFFKNKTIILHCPDQKVSKEIIDEVKSIRRDYEKLKAEYQKR